MDLKALLQSSDMMHFGTGVTGGRIFLPKLWQLRNMLLNRVTHCLGSLGYDELHLPDLISRAALDTMATIDSLPSYFQVDANVYLAATHEASFFSCARALIRHVGLPLRLYNIGPAYRRPKKAKSPFNVGERNTFVEAYYLCDGKDEAECELSRLNGAFRQLLLENLSLPSINVRRPQFGNRKFADKVISIETHLEEGRTFASAMIYDQGRRFTKAFGLNAKYPNVCSVHAAVTDNLLYCYLSKCKGSDGFRFDHEFAPVQVIIGSGDSSASEAETFCLRMKAIGIRCEHVADLRAARRKFLLGGAILLIIPDRQFGLSKASIFNRNSPDEPVFCTCSDEQLLVEMHTAGRSMKMQRMQQSFIEMCDTVDGINTVVAAGKVAQFFLVAEEREIAKLAGFLLAGEVLGFDFHKQNTGKCIITHVAEGRLCYAAQRV